jgi:predicted regulator of Ras-like GTPase activity (Roadblock/LC7/MglB family)
VEQFSLVTERYTTFLSAVTSEYFILLVLRPDGNYGRARFELRKAKHALQSELS